MIGYIKCCLVFPNSRCRFGLEQTLDEDFVSNKAIGGLLLMFIFPGVALLGLWFDLNCKSVGGFWLH